MIQIEQATFGDLNGAYSLLASSFANSDTPKRLCNSTDLIDRPPDGVLSGPVIRGFFKDDYFLLIKSFPDESADVRRGRVFSHALIIPEKKIFQIENFDQLLQHHMPAVDKTAQFQKIDLNNISCGRPSDSQHMGRINAAINTLSEHQKYDNTIAWIGDHGYWDWINRIWMNLPNPTKRSIKLGVAFNPQKIDTSKINLVRVPSNLKQNWSNTNYKLITSTDVSKISSQTANLLAGNAEEAKQLQVILADFDLQISEIDDLLLFERQIPIYEVPNMQLELSELLQFAHLISKYSSNPKSGTIGKDQLLKAVVSQIPNANPKEIIALANINWTPVDQATDQISIALTKWLDNNLFEKSQCNVNVALLKKALTNEPVNWWTSAVEGNLQSQLTKWQPQLASCLWKMFVLEVELIPALDSVLPDEAEVDLTRTLPKVENSIEERLLDLARKKNWNSLYGAVIAQNKSLEIAISDLLEDSKGRQRVARLKSLAIAVTPESFIEATLTFEDEDVLNVNRDLLVSKPALKQILELRCQSEIDLCEMVTKAGVPLFDGFKNPAAARAALFEFALNKNELPNEIWAAIAQSEYADLTNLVRRNEALETIPAAHKQAFIKRTVDGWISKYLKEPKENPGELDELLQAEASSGQAIRKYMGFGVSKISNVLGLWEQFDNATEQDLLELMNTRPADFTKDDCVSAGNLIKSNKWIASYKLAKHSLVKKHSRFSAVLEECKGVFPLIDNSLFSSLFSKTSPDISGHIKTNDSMNSGVRSNRTIVICSALSKEFKAVRSFISNVSPERHPETGTAYEVGDFNGWKICLVETDKGNTISATETERAFAHFNPSYAIFVGVAGGIKDVSIGDVVIASKVYSIESGKDDVKFLSRFNFGQSAYELEQVAKELIRDDEWFEQLNAQIGDQNQFSDTVSGFVAPVASGEKVISSSDSVSYKRIKDHAGDSLAVAMEEAGFLEVCKSRDSVKAVVIRGISDLIDAKEDADKKGSQELAALTASYVAFEIIRRIES